ncbi:MAG: hypothetical protein ACO1QB_12690 [Verrucomicrobiales bacterium]
MGERNKKHLSARQVTGEAHHASPILRIDDPRELLQMLREPLCWLFPSDRFHQAQPRFQKPFLNVLGRHNSQVHQFGLEFVQMFLKRLILFKVVAKLQRSHPK